MLNEELVLPKELEPFRQNIESSIKPYIEIKAIKEDTLTLWKSKFGGFPYFPKSNPYPRDAKNQPMMLLAQINFNETPNLINFPQQGILQFYIPCNDDLYGIDINNQTLQQNFRVLYFPEVFQNEANLITSFDFLPEIELTPLVSQYQLEFSLVSKPIPTSDYLFDETILGENSSSQLEEKYKIHKKYDQMFSSYGHKIGGYPYFTQNDPRKKDKYKSENYILLFQMDSDGDIMWGDVGIGNFFIKEQDLKKYNFSNILYNWDCA